jgi:hypothetical protein
MGLCVYHLGILSYLPASNGPGNCRDCVKDEKNRSCPCYQEVALEDLLRTRIVPIAEIERLLNKFPELIE